MNISKLGIGTANFGVDYNGCKELSQDSIYKILDECVANGINLIDTAREYGNSEKKIGDYIKRHPEHKLYVLTKFKKLRESDCRNKESIKEFLSDSIDESTRLLGTKPLAFLTHQMDEFVLKRKEFWDAVGELIWQRPIKLGISVYYDTKENKEIVENVLNSFGRLFVCMECNYNIEQRDIEEILPILFYNKVALVARGVFGKGKLLKNHTPGECIDFVLNHNHVKDGLVTEAIMGVNSLEQLRLNIGGMDENSV